MPLQCSQPVAHECLPALGTNSTRETTMTEGRMVGFQALCTLVVAVGWGHPSTPKPPIRDYDSL